MLFFNIKKDTRSSKFNVANYFIRKKWQHLKTTIYI